MLSFKEYLFKQPDDPSPDESQTRYQAYLVEYHGGVVKAEFSQYKEDEWWVGRDVAVDSLGYLMQGMHLVILLAWVHWLG